MRLLCLAFSTNCTALPLAPGHHHSVGELAAAVRSSSVRASRRVPIAAPWTSSEASCCSPPAPAAGAKGRWTGAASSPRPSSSSSFASAITPPRGERVQRHPRRRWQRGRLLRGARALPPRALSPTSAATRSRGGLGEALTGKVLPWCSTSSTAPSFPAARRAARRPRVAVRCSPRSRASIASTPWASSRWARRPTPALRELHMEGPAAALLPQALAGLSATTLPAPTTLGLHVGDDHGLEGTLGLRARATCPLATASRRAMDPPSAAGNGPSGGARDCSTVAG